MNYPSWTNEVSVKLSRVRVFLLSLRWFPFLQVAACSESFRQIEVFIEQKLLTSTGCRHLDGGMSSVSGANQNTRLIFRFVEWRLVNHRKLSEILHLLVASVYYSVWAEKSLGTRLSYPFKRSLALSLGCPLLPLTSSPSEILSDLLWGQRLTVTCTLKKFHSESRGEKDASSLK